MAKKRLLSGGRPTGLLHLGHYTGALQTFVRLQEDHECLWVISDLHMLTTKFRKCDTRSIYTNARNMVIDCIGAGMDPGRTRFYLQSNIDPMPQIYTIIHNLIPVSRVQDTPSLREMANHAEMQDLHLGLLAYPVLEAADILSMRAEVVPVGRDNIDHVEIAREIIQQCNVLYDASFALPEWHTGSANYLVGLDGNAKMSKSLNNAVYLRDAADAVQKKILSMPWSPGHCAAGEQSSFACEPVMNYLQVFHPDATRFLELKERYTQCSLSEREAKEELISILNGCLEPVRERIRAVSAEETYVDRLLKEGTDYARDIATETLKLLKHSMGMPVL